jgi:hypothetical protein
VKELNTFFDGIELHGGTHRGYLRVFNNGDHPNFDGTWVAVCIATMKATTSRWNVQIGCA